MPCSVADTKAALSLCFLPLPAVAQSPVVSDLDFCGRIFVETMMQRM